MQRVTKEEFEKMVQQGYKGPVMGHQTPGTDMFETMARQVFPPGLEDLLEQKYAPDITAMRKRLHYALALSGTCAMANRNGRSLMPVLLELVGIYEQHLFSLCGKEVILAAYRKSEYKQSIADILMYNLGKQEELAAIHQQKKTSTQ